VRLSEQLKSYDEILTEDQSLIQQTNYENLESVLYLNENYLSDLMDKFTINKDLYYEKIENQALRLVKIYKGLVEKFTLEGAETYIEQAKVKLVESAELVRRVRLRTYNFFLDNVKLLLATIAASSLTMKLLNYLMLADSANSLVSLGLTGYSFLQMGAGTVVANNAVGTAVVTKSIIATMGTLVSSLTPAGFVLLVVGIVAVLSLLIYKIVVYLNQREEVSQKELTKMKKTLVTSTKAELEKLKKAKKGQK